MRALRQPTDGSPPIAAMQLPSTTRRSTGRRRRLSQPEAAARAGACGGVEATFRCIASATLSGCSWPSTRASTRVQSASSRRNKRRSRMTRMMRSEAWPTFLRRPPPSGRHDDESSSATPPLPRNHALRVRILGVDAKLRLRPLDTRIDASISALIGDCGAATNAKMASSSSSSAFLSSPLLVVLLRVGPPTRRGCSASPPPMRAPSWPISMLRSTTCVPRHRAPRVMRNPMRSAAKAATTAATTAAPTRGRCCWSAWHSLSPARPPPSRERLAQESMHRLPR